MARLIDADELKETIVSQYGAQATPGVLGALHLIETAPTVDAEPVRHGKWIEVGIGFNYHFECSECVWKDGYPFNDRHKYCPNCGAKMGESDNEQKIHYLCR